MQTATLSPLRRVDGYLPPEDYGLVADGATAALTRCSGADLSEDAPAARAELLRPVEVLGGSVRLRVAVETKRRESS